ncbi:MAG: hypothetical protein A2381_12845 [Bdellovibrionales bacterium RIFOXYB1_FULL_37_110]|nr:MAG: hypothetical protein A2181_02170 [Bdellovibrionales bacterium RIFOXYA1_FULL_38_20]OFZ51594.1 MAG: hypothetical protein A2417_12505 [Bdellovibrionales bacterium RIFOXYC1_FULL_37_79]OFZ60421.1 MAG: hypothetical protein A2381_12845 [Bdellovibrionales bacterium RIFOXYB1_FULL_37_110]OFZ64994.1 MAG: hypothetical protein A2577_09110 [Bdellovibrionales bacterium RIFOXYD1_FULL_36_51]
MTIKLKNVFGVLMVGLLVISCVSEKDLKEKVKKAIEENPEMVIDAINKRPKEFVQVLQKAVTEVRTEEDKKARESEQKKLEEHFNNPLVPQIGELESVRGEKDAPITLVMYSDFQCPFCVQGVETVNKLREKYGKKMRYIYKHLPLVSLGHAQAPLAAEYFEAIAVQSVEKAYKFHDELYSNQRSIQKGEDFFKAVVRKLNVDANKLATDLKSERVKKKMENDQMEAQKFEFQGTPGFLLNGIPIYGALPVEYFESIIDRLKQSGKLSI